MTIDEISNRLYILCKDYKFEQAQRELYADDAESVEPRAAPEPRVTKGLDNIIKKGDAFQQMVETMHELEVTLPLEYGNSFSMEIRMDVTYVGQERQTIHEICVYQVENGKIVSEHFYY